VAQLLKPLFVLPDRQVRLSRADRIVRGLNDPTPEKGFGEAVFSSFVLMFAGIRFAARMITFFFLLPGLFSFPLFHFGQIRPSYTYPIFYLGQLFDPRFLPFCMPCHSTAFLTPV